MRFIEFNPDQARLLVDAGNQYDQWLEAKRLGVEYAGWMSWREKKGVDYLFRGESGGANQKGMGARTPETEALYRQFQEGKENAKTLLNDISARLAERAPLLKAARLGRILAPMAQVVREFDVRDRLGKNLIVGGTHAIAVYEALSGRFMQSDLMATDDLDFIWRVGQGIELLIKAPDAGLLRVLKSIDDTYTVNTERTFQVRNSKGLIIDFISDHENAQNAPKEYLKPVGIEGQEWLINAPTVDAVCIDSTGMPLKLIAPDPRVFAIHKLWVSQREDRNPLKKIKDQKQGMAIAELVKRHLPQYPINQQFVDSLPVPLGAIYQSQLRDLLDGIVPESNFRM